MIRQEAGNIAVSRLSTNGSTLFADPDLVEPPGPVLNREACSPVSFLTILSSLGRKDGFLTVTFLF